MAAAESALNQFQSQMRRGKLGPQYQLARAEARVYTVKGELLSFTSQYDAAAQSATKAVTAARRSLELGAQIDERRSFYARNELLNALARQARAHNARGALFDADQSLKQGLETIAGGDVSTHVMALLFSTIGSLRVQEGRYREAEHWARKSAEVMLKAGASATSSPLLAARSWSRRPWPDRDAGMMPGKKWRRPIARSRTALKPGKWPATR